MFTHLGAELQNRLKQKLMALNGEIGKYTITIEDLNVFLLVIDRISRKWVTILITWNNQANQFDLIGIFKDSPQQWWNTLFLSKHGTLTNIDHILGHKASLINLKRLQSYKLWSLTTMDFN